MDGPGWDVSIVSLGASSLGSVFRDTDDVESIEVVRTAVRHGVSGSRMADRSEVRALLTLILLHLTGINLIDTAPWYGHGKSETILGKALEGIPRNAYYLTTKVGR